MTDENLVLRKTKELCQAIVEQPEFARIRQGLDAFMSDEEVRSHYNSLSQKGEQLQQKQQVGGQLTTEEVADFERDREIFLNNPVARGFLDAQHEMHKMQESVSRYVNRTFELGRVPEADDMQSCGHGCNCHS
jgi:cell fate (sporulation/competence/biofilm development) regulator YlbF (YheA/YmcA/DUF963 family)